MSQTIAVIDYGMGNLHSAAKALENVAEDARVVITDDRQTILNADRIVFPGVGAIRDCVSELHQRKLDDVVREVAGQKPMLAICVGMQLMMRHSEENGGVDCLGIFDGNAEYFGDLRCMDNLQDLKVPHMGWNEVFQTSAHPMWQGIEQNARFYFVHSYCIGGVHASEIAGCCHYGKEFVAACYKDNLFAVQFHPEKSARNGLQLLENFTRWNGRGA